MTTAWRLPLAVLIVGMFMSILDISIVNVAIPTMQNDFGATPQDIQWISTAYTRCLGVVVPASAWLGDRVGLKRLYVVALVAFSAASALCGLAAVTGLALCAAGVWLLHGINADMTHTEVVWWLMVMAWP